MANLCVLIETVLKNRGKCNGVQGTQTATIRLICVCACARLFSLQVRIPSASPSTTGKFINHCDSCCGDSPYPTSLFSSSFENVFYLLHKWLPLYWQHRRQKPWSMSKCVPERLWHKVIFFQHLKSNLPYRYIIQSACAHTWSRDLVNQCRSVSVVCLPICFCPSRHLQQVAAILKSWLWVQAIGAI